MCICKGKLGQSSVIENVRFWKCNYPIKNNVYRPILLKNSHTTWTLRIKIPVVCLCNYFNNKFKRLNFFWVISLKFMQYDLFLTSSGYTFIFDRFFYVFSFYKNTKIKARPNSILINMMIAFHLIKEPFYRLNNKI